MRKITVFFNNIIDKFFELDNFVTLLKKKNLVTLVNAATSNFDSDNEMIVWNPVINKISTEINNYSNIIRLHLCNEKKIFGIEKNVKEMGEGCLNFNTNEMQYLIINSEAYEVFYFIYYNFPEWLEKNKIIIIRTQVSYDTFQYVVEDEIINSPLMKNVYATANPMIFDNDKVWDYGNKNNLRFLETLNSYGNLTQMPVWIPSSRPTITKEEFYKKYNLDSSKKLFTIYLQWPKLKKGRTCKNEIIFLENNTLFQKIKSILNEKGYNVIFKAHPFMGMKFKPTFTLGSFWESWGLKTRHTLPIEIIKEFISQNTFIEMVDYRNTDYFTDLGMIFNASTFTLHNYLFSVPLLHAPLNVENHYDVYQKRIGNKENWRELVYGTIVSFDDLLINTEEILTTFILHYEIKPRFKYRRNNPLYGIITLKKNNTKNFVNYIDSLLSKFNI
jgi:hypothetical protein